MKIAIIGTGISGLASAYLLQRNNDITIYEKNDYIGGHSRTVNINVDDQDVGVDTGFIVFNHKNYPHLTGLFNHLDVPTTPSNMSFGVSINNGWLEYGTLQKSGMFAQTTNFLKPHYWQMLLNIMSFNKNAPSYLTSNLTMGECLEEMKLGNWFKDYYLLAMGASIWSTPTKEMLNFPARTFIQFFKNHGLLTISDQPQWHTVTGGSKEYVKRITADLDQHILLNCGAKTVTRKSNHVEILDTSNNTKQYDQVIFACHSDQVLNILSTPSTEEKELIGAIRYQPNEMVLHRDTALMPKRRKAWSSWVYLSEQKNDSESSVSLSYWMNNLQPLPTNTPIIVTLNPGRQPDKNTVFDRHTFEHPVFDAAAIAAQEKIHHIQGKDRIWYTGAWLRYGFHEDGLQSAVKVATQLGATIPWQ